MTRLGLIDLEMLYLGIRGDGNFDEKDIENSELNRLGVGRILDSLASLKDRKLIGLNKDGTFFITDLGKHTLWNENIPLWVKILRILDIKSFTIKDISKFLKKNENEVFENIEKLRKNELVLMSPQRIDSKIFKIFEILPEGIEKLKNVEKEGVEKHTIDKTIKPKIEIISLVNQVIKEISDSEISQDKKEKITSKLFTIKQKMEI